MNYLLRAKYAFYSALVFFLFTNPFTWTFTQGIFGSFFTVAIRDCPTTYGIFLHAFLFFLTMFGLMTVPTLANPKLSSISDEKPL
jgi:DMSO/TMAO reductase YedYZ heme-binding membrane subunit